MSTPAPRQRAEHHDTIASFLQRRDKYLPSREVLDHKLAAAAATAELLKARGYATGGFGPDERLMSPDGALGRSLELYAGHAEIPCGSWAATWSGPSTTSSGPSSSARRPATCGVAPR